MLKKHALLCFGLITLAGCVSMTPRAGQVRLLPSGSTELANCKKLGKVSADASALSQMNWDATDAQARNNLRDAAAAKWGAGVNTIALDAIEHGMTRATANGMAYLCQ